MAEIEYLSNGVTISPAIPRPGDSVGITYSGLLAQNGADQVTAKIGFDSSWDNTTEIEMSKTPAGFYTAVPIYPNYTTLNVCFRDTAGNWDNNSGENYSFLLSKKTITIK